MALQGRAPSSLAESLGTVTALSFGASPAAPSSHQAPSSISFVLCCCSRSLAAITPTLPGSFSPWGLWPLAKPPRCPLRCLLSVGPLPAPLQRQQEQFSGREWARHRATPGRRYSFIVQVLTGLRTRQSCFLWLSPAPQWEHCVGFFCWFIFPLCCVCSRPGQVLPLPLGIQLPVSPPGGQAAPCVSQGFFCL